MFSLKQTHKLDYYICYHLESGCHVTRPNQGLSLGREKSLGTRLLHTLIDRTRIGKREYENMTQLLFNPLIP